MAMSVPKGGLARMMKEGARRFQGVEEAVYRNIEACEELSGQVKSAFGPQGMNKMVINHLQKLFVTKDAATILSELEVQHPAAKMIVMACQMQSKEVGDGANTVLILASALLEHAGELLRMGLKPAEIAEGYDLALDKAMELLPSLEVAKVSDLRSKAAITAALRTSIASKQYGHEEFLAGLVADACLASLPKNAANFSVDNVRVTKILGSGVTASSVLNGMVFKRAQEGHVKIVQDATIAVFTCPFDLTQTETKGTVLLSTAAELKGFAAGEEAEVEAQVKAIADAGINCVVAGGKFGDLYLHYLNQLGIMAVRVMSKFDLRRLCRTLGATASTKISVPDSDCVGRAGEVCVDEIGDTNVVLFKAATDVGRVSTVVIRGSSENLMDDVERAINAGVNTFKALTKDGRLVAGAGATEIELARQITAFGDKAPGLEQYAIRNFALALEALPKQLADNAGLKATEVMSQLYAAHDGGSAKAGFDCEGEKGGTVDAAEAGILDLLLLKHWALRLATNAATTVLKVDEIIVAKQAGGGPAPRAPKPQEDEECLFNVRLASLNGTQDVERTMASEDDVRPASLNGENAEESVGSDTRTSESEAKGEGKAETKVALTDEEMRSRLARLAAIFRDGSADTFPEALEMAGLGRSASVVGVCEDLSLDGDEAAEATAAQLAEVLEAARALLLRRLTLLGLRHGRLVFLLGRFHARFGEDVFQTAFVTDTQLPLGLLKALWGEKETVYRRWQPLAARCEVLRRLCREFHARLRPFVARNALWADTDVPDFKVHREEPAAEDYSALGGETEELASVELLDGVGEGLDSLVAVAELWHLEEEVVLRTVGRSWELGAETVLKNMESPDWNLHDMGPVDENAVLFGLSQDVRERMPRVLKAALAMGELHLVSRLTDIMYQAYGAMPGGFASRERFYKTHFQFLGPGFLLDELAGDCWVGHSTELLSSLHVGSIGAGESDPRRQKLCAEFLWFFLLNPRSHTLALMTAGLEKEFLAPILASVLRSLRCVAERKEDGVPIGIAAIRCLLDKSQELVFKDGSGDAFISLVAQLCRKGAESEPFVDPSQLILTFLCPSLEKDRGNLTPLLLRLFQKLIKHRETSVEWSLRDPGAEAWEGAPADASDADAAGGKVQYVVVLELMMKVWQRAADMGRASGRQRQLAFEVIGAVLGGLGKKLSGRLDAVCLSWLTQDRLNGFPWQYKTAIVHWLPQVTNSELVIPRPEAPQCLHELVSAETGAAYSAVRCPAYRSRSHRGSADGKESCALDSLFELLLLNEDAAIELVEAGCPLSQLDSLEEKLGERMLRNRAFESPQGLVGLLGLVRKLQPAGAEDKLPVVWRQARSAMRGSLAVQGTMLLVRSLAAALDKLATNAMFCPGEKSFIVKIEKVESLVGNVAVVCKEEAETLAAATRSAASPSARALRKEEEAAGLFQLFAHLGLLAQASRKLPGGKTRDLRPLQLLLLQITRQTQLADAFATLAEPVADKPALPPAPATDAKPPQAWPLPKGGAKAAKGAPEGPRGAAGGAGTKVRLMGLGRGKWTGQANGGLVAPDTAALLNKDIGPRR